MSDLNPRIQTTRIGITTLMEKTLYPLSVHDQLKVTELVGSVVDGFSDDRNVEGLTDIQIVQKFSKTIEENIEQILGYVSGPKEENKIDLKDLDNDQLTEIIDIIFTVNYENSIKNLQALRKRAQLLFPSKK